VAAAVLAVYVRDRGIPAMAAAGNWAGVRRAVNGGLTGWQTFADAVEGLKAIAPPVAPPSPPVPEPAPAPAGPTRAELDDIIARLSAFRDRLSA
jgi:hypothetical protein